MKTDRRRLEFWGKVQFHGGSHPHNTYSFQPKAGLPQRVLEQPLVAASCLDTGFKRQKSNPLVSSWPSHAIGNVLGRLEMPPPAQSDQTAGEHLSLPILYLKH
jgi:hypothetical protein